jgi:hypothetical protein
MIRFVLLLPLSVLLVSLILAGCGGGGSGGTSSTGVTGTDPVEIEVAAALDTFFKAVAGESLAVAMTGTAPNLQYWRTGLKLESQTQFSGHLSGFFDKAASISVALSSPAITATGEASAMVRGTLVCTYTDASGQSKSLTEPIEFVYEKLGSWQITSMSDPGLTAGMVFPPAL